MDPATRARYEARAKIIKAMAHPTRLLNWLLCQIGYDFAWPAGRAPGRKGEAGKRIGACRRFSGSVSFGRVAGVASRLPGESGLARM